jgi:chitin synthase
MDNVGTTEKNAQIVVFGRVYWVRELNAEGKESGLSEMGLKGIRAPWGVDRSAHFASYASKEDLAILEDHYAGSLDQRDCLTCRLSSHLIVGSSFFLLSIVLIKLFAAFQQLLWVPKRKRTTNGDKKPGDKFVIIQVPCFTESKAALRATLNSLAMLRYDDKRKLLFIVTDGVVTGKGNGKATSEILKELLGIDCDDEPPAFAYQSVTTGVPSLNRCQVYSGLYECSGQRIPFVLLVKIGRQGEAEDKLNSRPGNRGKRDSQMILFRFLGRLFHRQPFCPLEVELFRHIKWIIGIDPSLYEFVMMVDADTQVHADSVSRMVEMYELDHRLIGVCGESRLSNEKATWVTAVQVYEYFVSHNINKAFESLFGSVTCLPGCFCMYRIKDGGAPYLVHPTILANYGKSNVASLHWKNLLSLGEDRYLTTLMLKHFPEMRLEYCPRAVCWTAVPETWPVLLSQRRRWINSTVHNLVELLALPPSLFSLRFVVILDLLGTLLMPAGLIYLACLLFESVIHQHATSTLSLLLLVAVYALQSLIFMARREWQYIGWLGIHILAIPLSGFVIPLYAYWRYDELGWGATRKVYGSAGKKTERIFDADHARVAEVMRLKPYSEYSKDPEKQPWPVPQSPIGSPSAEAFLAQLFQSADLTMMTKRQARTLLAEHLSLDPQRHAAHLDSLIEHHIHSVYT